MSSQKVTLDTLPEHSQTHDKSNSWWEYDAQNIPLCRVCDACESAALSRYRPEILRGYTQADVDEPIDGDSDIEDRAADALGGHWDW